MSNRDKIFLEPRAYNTFIALVKHNSIKYNYNIRPAWILTQKSKGLIISSSLLGLIYKSLFSLFVLITPSPRSFSDIEVDDGLSNGSINNSIFSKPDTNRFIPFLDNIFFTFHCARRDSYLSVKHLNSVITQHPNISLLQHFPSRKVRDQYLTCLDQIKISPDSYFGSDPLTQILAISDSSLLISVASSCAKFAIMLSKPLVLLLFPTHNSSFYQYYNNRLPFFENSAYKLFKINSIFIIINFKVDNTALSPVDLLSSMDRALVTISHQ